ncbi:MAG: DNA methylase, partial [Elusimicrobia bacterium CG02_land_8_20_14_3_00_37_13]
MQNLLEELKNLLEQDERLVVDGKLLKNKIIELSLKLDADLIKLLLKNETIKKHFFQEVDGVLVFDKIKFQKFISNKAFLPDSYTSFKNKIGLVTENEEYLSESKEVVLAWPYKDCVLEGRMEKEDEKRDEIFYNEILAPEEIDRLLEPKVLTNFKRIDKNGGHKFDGFKADEKGDIKENLIIKGNNLLVLHSLQKCFAGKVKLIYIDPPYNTGGEANIFTYNNSFNHSSWLTFIKNRLEVAKGLLRKDGFMAITIDHNELFYLGEVADEILGRENRLGVVTIVIKPEGRQFAKFFAVTNEFMLVYAKDINVASFEDVIIDE